MSAAAQRVADPPSSVRVLAQGRGWRISDVHCRRGPHDRPFEEQHGGVSFGAVLSGTFQYRSAAGRALLYPGAVLLGRPGACFECGHEHGTGDRCLALQFDADAFEEVAAGAGAAHLRWTRPMLPSLRMLAAPLARVQARLQGGDVAGIEEAALLFGEAVVRALEGGAAAVPTIASRELQRISAVLRHIERHSREPLDLDTLAALACMSKYHFLRSFRRSVGMTPHQYLLQQRVRHVARALRESDEGVATLAFAAGFGDLSTFHALFRDVFGSSPAVFRRDR